MVSGNLTFQLWQRLTNLLMLKTTFLFPDVSSDDFYSFLNGDESILTPNFLKLTLLVGILRKQFDSRKFWFLYVISVATPNFVIK